MTSWADQTDVLISLAVGMAAALYGFGVIGRRPGAIANPRQARFIQAAKWFGPVLVVVSVIRLVAGR